MNTLTAILAAAPEELARLLVHDQMPNDERPGSAGSMWDNRPSWDNWQKHR